MLFRSWALAGNVPCLLSPRKRDTLKKGLLTIISNPFLIQRSSALLKQGRAALLTPSGSCGPWHGGGPALCGRSWCSYAAGNHARGCADASWAGKYASFFIPPVKIPVWAVSWLNPYRGSLAVLDYTRYKGPLSRVFRNFIRRNVELWSFFHSSPIFGRHGLQKQAVRCKARWFGRHTCRPYDQTETGNVQFPWVRRAGS